MMKVQEAFSAVLFRGILNTKMAQKNYMIFSRNNQDVLRNT